MKKVLFIIHDINYGGAAKMMTFLANSFSNQGDKVYIYTYAGDSKNYTLDESIKYYSRKPIKKSRLMKFLDPIIPVRKMIKKINPDVVISFLTNANLYCILGTMFTGIPLIIGERGDPFMEDNYENRIKKFFYNFSEGAVFQTQGAKGFYNKAIQEKSAVIPNPVTIQDCEIIPYENRNNEIVFVARFDISQKRQDIMVEAFAKVAKQVEDIKLVFYGDGKDRGIIEKRVDELGLSNRVIFAGKVSNVIDKIKKAKISVLTSDFEGIPNALIESMSVGVPVVSTDCSPGGARLLISNKKNGIIVPRGNVNEIANAILYLINNPDTAKEFANKALKIKVDYSYEKIISLWNNYIEKVVN